MLRFKAMLSVSMANITILFDMHAIIAKYQNLTGNRLPNLIDLVESTDLTGLTHYKNELVSTEEIVNSSVKIFDFPVRDGKTLRTYDLTLPKFHLILPKFYFSPPWGIFVCSVDILHFPPRRVAVIA